MPCEVVVLDDHPVCRSSDRFIDEPCYRVMPAGGGVVEQIDSTSEPQEVDVNDVGGRRQERKCVHNVVSRNGALGWQGDLCEHVGHWCPPWLGIALKPPRGRLAAGM